MDSMKPSWLEPNQDDIISEPQFSQSQPQSPPILVPTLLSDYLARLMATEQYRHDVDLENERLRNKLNQKQLSEEAYAKTLSIAGRCTCVQSKNGVWVPILNSVIEKALFFYSEAPLKSDPYYIMQVSQGKGPILLEEKEFMNDKLLLARLQEAGVEVTIRKSPHATATLIRQAICRVLHRIPRRAYAGWAKHDDGVYRFSVFYPFSSHRLAEDLRPAPLPPAPHAVTKLAIETFWPTFEVILNPCLRWFLFSWTNIAFLDSLLRQLGFEIPMGLYVFAPTTDISAYIHRLLCWYGDQSLSLNSPPSVFAEGLLHRKDQPLLIDDASRSKHVTANAETLEDALLTHHLPWRNGRDIQQLPLQALPTVVSSTVSDLACSPSLVTLDLSPDQFAANCYRASFDSMNSFQDYIIALANYTSRHIPELQSALKAGHAEAWDTTDGTLTEPCVKMLGILYGIRKFLDNFFNEHGVSPVTPPAEELDCWLMEILQQTSEKADLMNGLADEFILVARDTIQHRQVGIFPLSERKVQGATVIYYDDSSLYFTVEALKAICDQMSASRPMILRALATAGFIQGAPINRTTSQTRVRLYNVYGKPLPMAMYRLRRDTFDWLGDPLILGEDQV